MKKEKGYIAIILLVVLVVLLIGGYIFFSGIVERKVDKLLKATDIPQLVTIAEEDDSLEILINEYTVHAEKISELEKENEALKAKVAELSDAKDTIQSIFKTKDSK